MARIGGRSPWLAWPVAILCAAVVVALFGLALPLVPATLDWAGSALRGTIFAPSSADSANTDANGAEANTSGVDSSECRGLYTDRLWSELTARNGGEPLRDTSPPMMAATAVAAGLAPIVTQTCTWTGASTGSITTTVSEVSSDATAIAEAALASQGYSCAPVAGGISCTWSSGDVTEEHVLRDETWLATQFSAWHPSLYTERVSEQLWGQ